MTKKERDFTGMKFGEWTVLEKDKENNKRWICECSCGVERSIGRQSLWIGESKSCGCRNIKFKIGDKFGKLTIIKIYNGKKKRGRRADCICECGNEINVSLLNLRCGKTTTCGCLRTKNIIGEKFGQLLVIEKDLSKKRNPKSTWYLCLCDCGEYCYRNYSNLILGVNNNCGKHNLIVRKAKWLLKEYDYEKNKNINIENLTTCSSTKVWWKCQKCGNSWIKKIVDRYSGSLCPNCIESRGNKLIREALLENNIRFEQEKRFKDCKYKRSLPFDFYLPDYNLLIEYQGRQHYKDKSIWTLDDDRFNYIKNNDNIKKQYCIDKQINFLEIKYTKIKKIEEILLNKIKELSHD